MTNKEIKLNSLNYKDLKKTQLKLNEIVSKLHGVKVMDSKKIPLILRSSFSQVRKLIINIDKYRNALNTKIHSLDKTQKGIFKVVPEDTLWKKRVQVYDYLV